MSLKDRQAAGASGDSAATAASLRLPNERAVGIKISGKTIEATSTNGSVMVPGKSKVVTRMAAATLR